MRSSRLEGKKVTISIILPILILLSHRALAKTPAIDCVDLLTSLSEETHYLSTKDLSEKLPKISTLSNLMSAVQAFEKTGGAGEWATGQSPFQLGPQVLAFYRIRSLPKGKILKSSLFLLRTKSGRELVQSVFDSATPLFLTSLTDGTAEAFVLPGNYEPANHLLKIDKSVHRNILVIQPEATQFILAHEYRHWLDYEDPIFEAKLTKIQNTALKAGLSEDDALTITQSLVEWRGHSAQELAAIEAKDKKNALVDRAGHLTEHPNKFAYDFEISQGPSLFLQTYWGPLGTAMSKLKTKDSAGYATVYAIFREMELSPNGSLAFKRLLLKDP